MKIKVNDGKKYMSISINYMLESSQYDFDHVLLRKKICELW